MAIQGELFAQSGAEIKPSMPEGFCYEEDFITHAEEAALVGSLGRLELKPFQFHGHLGNRRVTSFGFSYDYDQHILAPSDPFPTFLVGLISKVAKFSGLNVDEFQQCGVNMYPAGAGIGWHKDKAQFGLVIGVSLLAGATLRLRSAQGDNWIRVTQALNPRSIYILKGDARTMWEHSIPPVTALRYSLTFRTFKLS